MTLQAQSIGPTGQSHFTHPPVPLISVISNTTRWEIPCCWEKRSGWLGITSLGDFHSFWQLLGYINISSFLRSNIPRVLAEKLLDPPPGIRTTVNRLNGKGDRMNTISTNYIRRLRYLLHLLFYYHNFILALT